METHTEISRQSANLFSAEQVAKTIGADLETINEWLDVGAVDRAVFGGGQLSRYELHRVALVFELVKLGFSPSCARDIVREMEYDLQLVWTRIPSDFKAYAIIIPAGRKWLVSWCWKKSSEHGRPLKANEQQLLESATSANSSSAIDALTLAMEAVDAAGLFFRNTNGKQNDFGECARRRGDRMSLLISLAQHDADVSWAYHFITQVTSGAG